MNARLICRCSRPRPLCGAGGLRRRLGWCGHKEDERGGAYA
jgi:hypothetical protein